jgi:hypothetical protein
MASASASSADPSDPAGALYSVRREINSGIAPMIGARTHDEGNRGQFNLHMMLPNDVGHTRSEMIYDMFIGNGDIDLYQRSVSLKERKD